MLVFGGTTEGREIAEWLSTRGGCEVFISSLTEFGSSLVEGLENVTTLTGRLLPGDIENLLRDQGFDCVIDATHPYAAGVSTSIAEAATACNVTHYRVLREEEPKGPWTCVDSPSEAAAYLARHEGRILFTTGSKDLPIYAGAIENFCERAFVRILPVASSLEAASNLGLAVNHIIAMKGPFSKELNCALIRDLNIDVMVTKASGAAGGFWEKVDAARECGIELLVIHRPTKEDGLSLEELKGVLEKTLN